jgi:hypothetical protein
VSLRSVAVTVLLASDQAPLELTAYTRNEYVLLSREEAAMTAPSGDGVTSSSRAGVFSAA